MLSIMREMGERSHLPTLKYHHGVVAHEILDAEKLIHTFFFKQTAIIVFFRLLSKTKRNLTSVLSWFPPMCCI